MASDEGQFAPYRFPPHPAFSPTFTHFDRDSSETMVESPTTPNPFLGKRRRSSASHHTARSKEIEEEETDRDSVGDEPSTSREGQVQPQVVSRPEKPYSIFTRKEKWFIVFMTAVAGFYSPLSANIYFPAIPILSEAFQEPIELINVTVTVNMLFQGISPMLWGSLADSQHCGRRPVYLACLLLLTLSCIGLALTPTSAYWLLVFLRCFQAAGSSPVIALGAGTIVDIATSAERGGFLGLFNVGPMIGPCIGPVIGGLLADQMGWRSVFWFLAIASGVAFIFEYLLLPETLRTIVGDGSAPPPKLNRPLIPILGRGRKSDPSSPASVPEKATSHHTPLTVLRLFRNPDLCLVLVSTAIPYSVFYGVITTMSPLFLQNYPWLTESDIGLCYLANGGGCLLGSFTVGKMLDWEWQRVRRSFAAKGQLEDGGSGAKGGVPVEYARLRTTPLFWGAAATCVLLYGWLTKARVHIGVLLLFQFLIGFLITALFNINQTLLMDLFPQHGAGVTACNNLVRCLTGATFVSIENYILDGVGPGWGFTIFAAMIVATYPAMLVEWKHGKKWRKAREEREQKKGVEREKKRVQKEREIEKREGEMYELTQR
ncbi:MFS general substrate transporter [Dacryopinax primogenitus]|uniref:MFS general substrate transporter n=1 Tax=Dacryopinax primogenitus (strain DJM 731) TaxID=1858805 RepID=M5GBC9_DACPD|nr:MFS general substrate transporter [Dacryopinax primogenitus]EJU05680.1 MFS general substrate transporter [Dacryopinax primogenitus]